jgi:NAD(P)-dependent dehydrogenase (short-subunit alcohol dehydrogenase family)
MEKIFQNKTVLITGGSYGIGRAAANVVLADWKEDPQQTTIKLIQVSGAKAMFIVCDVSRSHDVKVMFDKISQSFGRLDFAFNNAGVEGETAPVHECSEENWEHTLAINLKGVWLCMKEEILQMRRQGEGVIINCSSVAGLKGFANLPAYVASKHGIVGLTKSAALENATSHIRVNAICPGVIHTQMVDRITQSNPTLEKQYVQMEPVGRMGQPEEIAEAVVWLCSNAASFVTGQAFAIDGGLMAG